MSATLPTMSGDFSLFVTSVTNAGAHISFHAQLNAEKFAALDNMINSLQGYFEKNTVGSPYELQPGEMVLVKSVTGGTAKWHRARVFGLQGVEFGTVSVEYVDYGTNELAHFTQICATRSPATGAILSQPPLAVPCVLAEVTPALGAWTDAALGYVESKLRSQQPVKGQLLRQDVDGVWHVRVYTGDGNTLASQLVALGLGRLATANQLTPAQMAATRAEPPAALFAVKVKEMTSVPPPPGSETLVTICHYISGPAKFAVQLHDQKPALQQLMREIQTYCQSSPAVPLVAVESGVICLGSSATREGRFLRGVITQADGNVVKVYWADYGNDETKVASELRAMPRQFAQLRIQASRVSLAGLATLTPVQNQQHVFRQITEGSVLTGRFGKPREQPAGTGNVCLNQVELFDMGVSVLDLLVRAGAYERRPGSATPTTPAPTTPLTVTLARPASSSPPRSPPPLTPGTHAEVLVVSVTSVNSLHVRPLETEPALQQMVVQLTDALNVSACPLTVDRVAEGVMCAAFKDAGYQRARIVSVGRRDMKVLYVDLGTSEIIPTTAAFTLEPRLAAHPPQAVHCCLAGLEMSHGTPELVELLRTMTAGGRLLCEVQDQLGEKRIVRLTDLTSSPPPDVGATLREKMAGRRVLPSPTPAPAKAPAAPAIAVRPPEVELGRSELVVVMHVESAAEFFGQLVSVDADAMYAMEEAMQAVYGGRVTPLRPAAAGTFCVARSAINGTFYRARVLSVQGTKLAIQYIDYGDTETKTPAEVYPLSAEFTRLPQLGLFCSLVGGEAVPADTFRQLAQDQTMDVLPVSGSGDHYRVSLPPTPDNQPLLAQLKRFGVTNAPQSSPAENGTPVSPGPAAPAPAAGDVPALQLPIGLFKDVEVVHVVTPSEFYVRLREQAGSLACLQAGLASYAAAPPAPVVLQQTVAVRRGEGWSRGRVTARQVDQVTVYLLDSGETVTAPLAAVRPLRPEHGQLSAQAVRCSANGARPTASSGWTGEEIAKFRHGAWERSFLARAEEVRGGTAVVTLAQAEPVTPGVLSSPPPPPPHPTRAADTNNNSKRVSSPRADQDPNWRDKTSSVPPTPSSASASASASNWRAADSQPSGGFRVERRASGGRAEPAAPASAQPTTKPPRPETQPGWKSTPDAEPEPKVDRFAGKMRMDNPAEYARRRHDDGGRGDAQDGVHAAGRRTAPAPAPADNDWDAGDAGKSAKPTPTQTPAKPKTEVKTEIAAHGSTIERRVLPRGEPLRVTPTWVAGLGRFYVQRCPPAQEFTRLMDEMQRFYGGLSAEDGQETEPAPGKPVAARFTDGAWYRAAVRAASAAELRVLFLDYGNCEAVPPREVKRLKEQHCRLPAQAYCCKFVGVEPTGGEWKTIDEKQLAKYFSGDLEVTSQGSSGSVSEVEVVLAGQKVTDLLVTDGLAVRPEPAQTLQQEHLGPFRPLAAEFRRGDKVPVFVSYIVGPDRLSCQLSANATPLEQLETQIEAATADCKPVGSAAAGAGCLAPFDGTYYRGVVVSCSADSASVYFVDYGNTETVSVAELLECPESLRSLPAQAVRLCLTGVPEDRTADLTARADQMEFVARLDRVAPGHLEVTLLDGDTNINLELGGTEPAAAPAPTATKTAPAAPAAAAAPAAVAATPTKKVSFAPTPEAADAPAERRHVFVSFTVSPEEFYVQDASSAEQLDELMTLLDAEYSQLAEGERAVDEVQPGDLLAAPFSEDGAFYRARVLSAAESDPAQLHLQFIDYGNSERSARANCRLLTPPLLAPAPFAQRCRLAAARPPPGGWTPAAGTALDTLVGAPDGQAGMVVVKDEGNGLVVRLAGIGGEDVAAALVEAGHAVLEEDGKPAVEEAQREGPAAEEEAPTSPSAAVTAAGLASLVPGRPAAAVVAYSLGPCDFWAQLLADSARLDALMEALEAAGDLPAVDSPAAGALAAVRYSEDGALYRARVDSVADDACRVLFIDYGNTESVAGSELRQLPAAVASEPPMAVHSTLPMRPAEGAADAAVARFAELADGELELELTLISTGDPALVALRHDGRDLMQTMVEEGLAVPVETKVVQQEEGKPAEDKTRDVAVAGDAQEETKLAESQETAAEKKQIGSEDHEKDESAAGEGDTSAVSQLDDPGEHEVYISHVNSPLDFYVQSPDTTVLDDIMERLAATDAASSPPVAEPQPTDLLSAPFSEDGALYRARVLATADGRARVLFVDYGNGEEVPCEALRRLPAELAAPPPQALRCRLAVGACAAAAADRLRELTEEGARLTRLACAADAVGPLALVRLTVGGGDVAETLAAAELCRPARRATLPPALPPPLDAEISVRVTHVEDGGEVYLMPAADAAVLQELRQMMATLYDEEATPAPAAPAEDDLCVVRGADGAWHRALVLAVDSGADTARLHLVDSGATLEAPLAELREPRQAVTLPPRLAHRCRLPAAPRRDYLTADCVKEACRRGDGAVTARLAADGDTLLVELSIEGEPVGRVAPADDATDWGERAVRATDDAVIAATPSPGRRCRDDKIVPGQISFSLLVDPETAEDPVDPKARKPSDRPQANQETPTVEIDGPERTSSGSTKTGTPMGTPIGRRLSHECKIVPGQISFCLLSEPPPEVDTETTPEEDKQATREVDTGTTSKEDTETTPKEDIETTPKVDAATTLELDGETTSSVDAETAPEVRTETTLENTAAAPEVDTEAVAELGAETTPMVVTKTTPEVDTETTSEVDIDTTRKVDAESTQKVETEATPEVDIETTSKVDTGVKLKVEAESTPKEDIKITAIPEVDTKTTPKNDTETTSEVGTETVPEVRTETVREDTATTPEVGTETAPKVDTETTPKVNTETMAEVGAEATLKLDTETTQEVDTEPTPEVDAETAPKVDTATTPKVDTETTAEVDVEITPKVDIETVPEVRTETVREDKATTPEVATETAPKVDTKITRNVDKETTAEVDAEPTLKVDTETTTEVDTEATPGVDSKTTVEVVKETALKVGRGTTQTVNTETTLEVDTEPTPEVDTETAPEVDIETTLKVVTETTPEVDVETKPKVDTGTAPERDTETVPEVRTETTPEDTEATPEVDIEATPEVDTEATPEVDIEATPEVDTEATPEVDTEATPEVDTEATPEVDTEATPGVDTEATPEVDTEATPEVDTEATPEVDTGATPKVDKEATPGVDIEAIPEVDTEATPGVDTEATPEVDTEATPEVDTEATSEVDTEATPKVDKEATPGVDIKATPEVDTEATPGVDIEATPEVDTEATPEVDTEATPEVDTEAMPEVDLEVTPEVDTEATPEMDTEATPEVDTGTTPEADAEITPDLDIETTEKADTETTSENTGATPGLGTETTSKDRKTALGVIPETGPEVTGTAQGRTGCVLRSSSPQCPDEESRAAENTGPEAEARPQFSSAKETCGAKGLTLGSTVSEQDDTSDDPSGVGAQGSASNRAVPEKGKPLEVSAMDLASKNTVREHDRPSEVNVGEVTLNRAVLAEYKSSEGSAKDLAPKKAVPEQDKPTEEGTKDLALNKASPEQGEPSEVSLKDQTFNKAAPEQDEPSEVCAKDDASNKEITEDKPPEDTAEGLTSNKAPLERDKSCEVYAKDQTSNSEVLEQDGAGHSSSADTAEKVVQHLKEDDAATSDSDDAGCAPGSGQDPSGLVDE